IWFWAVWECAQLCVMNKLKTPPEKPRETFLALEGEINSFFELFLILMWFTQKIS
ncbi:unnamed protein product, partial [Rotaria magnacalcarata]